MRIVRFFLCACLAYCYVGLLFVPLPFMYRLLVDCLRCELIVSSLSSRLSCCFCLLLIELRYVVLLAHMSNWCSFLLAVRSSRYACSFRLCVSSVMPFCLPLLSLWWYVILRLFAHISNCCSLFVVVSCYRFCCYLFLRCPFFSFACLPICRTDVRVIATRLLLAMSYSSFSAMSSWCLFVYSPCSIHVEGRGELLASSYCLLLAC